MTSTSEPPHKLLRTVLSGRMLIAAMMGFASGLPLLLTVSVLQAWMKKEGVDLGTIGLFGLVGLPYTIKFLWAPLVDRYTLPKFGRRRGWLLAAQISTIAAILLLGLSDPVGDPLGVALAALLLTFFSATQDIVIDAYRRESLADDEQALGAGYYVSGYRVGTLVASGGGLILADFVGFPFVYVIMAIIMLSAVIITLLAPEPDVPGGAPERLVDAVVRPFIEFFRRRDAVLVLLFIVLYKIGDMMASHMTIPFYLETGFSNTEIGTVVKLFGFWPTIGGSILGGILVTRLGLYRSLWAFGILQGVSTAGFVWLAMVGYSIPWLAAVIGFENITMGMGTAALIGFMATLTDKKFTATQFALLSSLSGVPRVFITAPTGFMAQAMGWPAFFAFCALIAIPGLLLLTRFKDWLGASGSTQQSS